MRCDANGFLSGSGVVSVTFLRIGIETHLHTCSHLMLANASNIRRTPVVAIILWMGMRPHAHCVGYSNTHKTLGRLNGGDRKTILIIFNEITQHSFAPHTHIHTKWPLFSHWPLSNGISAAFSYSDTFRNWHVCELPMAPSTNDNCFAYIRMRTVQRLADTIRSNHFGNPIKFKWH